MSLICDETGRVIRAGEKLYAGTREDVGFYSALCAEVIAKIPKSERRDTPCAPGDGGVDIHIAVGERGGNGNYMISRGFMLRKFLFSISMETARKYLPGHYARYVEPN